MDNLDANFSNQIPAASGNLPGSSPFFHSSSSDEDGDSAEALLLETATNQPCQPSGASSESSNRHHKNEISSGNAGNKICRVCGDKALGYNFNVVSCESCKAFFRRNALKKKEFVCPFNNVCDVTYVSRRFCQKCRLRKCFDVGMNPDWIMSEEALAAKRRRRIESANGSMEKIAKISPEPRKLTPSCFGNQRIGGAEPILIAANTTDGLAVLANCASPAPASQQQFALLTQSGTGTAPKMITIVPVQQLQQPGFSQQKLDSTNAIYCYGGSTTGNVLLAGTSQSNSSIVASSVQSQPSPIVKSDEDTINIPKNVLINLITKFSASDAASLGHELTKTTSIGQSGIQSRNPPRQCCCKCTCGAKTNVEPIGIDKSDKMISTDDFHYQERYFQSGNVYTVNSTSASSSTASGLSMASPLDFSTTASTRGCRGLSQQHISNNRQHQHQQQQGGNNRQQQSIYGDMLDAAIISVFHDGTGCTTTSSYGAQPHLDSSYMEYNQPTQYRQLSAVERQRLEELLAANEVMKEPLEGMNEQRIYEGHNVDPKLMDVINMTDIAVRRIIKMNKRIEAFRNLCQEDQIALLKGGCTELMILRGIMTYDPEKDSWLTRVHNTGHEYIKLEVLKGVKGNVYEEHKNYVQSFPAAWRTSEPIMLILGAITLFNPGRPNTVHKELVKLEQQFYYELLKNYLSTIYDVHEAETAHSGLIDRLGTLHRVNEYAASIFLDINPKDVEPLLIEIFDLKK